MKFIVINSYPATINPNICYLLVDNWDDYNFKTSFILYYGIVSNELRRIGSVKIGKKSQDSGLRVDMIEGIFEELDDQYFSLGQEQSYYEEMMTLDEEVRGEILDALKDVVYNEKIYHEYNNESVFQISLMRSIKEYQILKLFKSILLGDIHPTPFKFSFIIGDNKDSGIKVHVRPNSTPPTNVHVIIGRNGVGKTRMLSGIADKLTQNQNKNEFSLEGKVIFPNSLGFLIHEDDESENFSNLVTIVFSAFDGFTPIKKEDLKGNIRYDYVGLRQIDEPEIFKTPDDLNQEFLASLVVCLSGQRKKRWLEAVQILNADPVFMEYNLEHYTLGSSENPDIISIAAIFNKLSSGHKIILLSITRLVELVDEKTLVLIDEPENHLHPPLLASYIRAISNLLVKRNGVALIATHSPVVLQEVPRSCITVVNKVRSEYNFTKPEIETFAENVGVLTNEVFKLEVKESGHYKVLSDYVLQMNYEELMEKFHNQIGAEGRAIVRAMLATEAKTNA